MENFKTTKIISTLKKFIKKNTNTNTNISPITDSENLQIKICLKILQRKISEWENPYLNRISITDKDWIIVSDEDSNVYLKEQNNLERTNKISLVKKILIENFDVDRNNNNDIRNNIAIDFDFKDFNFDENLNFTYDQLREYCIFFLEKIKKIQLQLNIDGEKNIWIMKPSGLSRGRGIKCFSNLNEILLFIRQKSREFMIQKYIENPLLIMGRKVLLNFFIKFFLLNFFY